MVCFESLCWTQVWSPCQGLSLPLAKLTMLISPAMQPHPPTPVISKKTHCATCKVGCGSDTGEGKGKGAPTGLPRTPGKPGKPCKDPRQRPKELVRPRAISEASFGWPHKTARQSSSFCAKKKASGQRKPTTVKDSGLLQLRYKSYLQLGRGAL